MVVMVLRSELGHIVIDITNRQFSLYALDTHRFQQQKRRGSRCVLRERLVDPQTYLITGNQLT